MRIICLLALLISPFGTTQRSRLAPLPPELLPGIDVSHYQRRINWAEVVAKQPLEFAFVKATEGQDYTDSLFCCNWAALSQHGVRRGAYHFFRAYGCGYEQAQHFLSTVDMQPGDLAPVLDIELTDGIAPEIMREEALIWLQTIEAALHVKPIIYSNQHFYDKHLAGWFDHYPLWVARYSTDRPMLSTGRDWQFWQYTNEGCLDGIGYRTDLNVFAGTPAMLDALRWFPPASPETQAAEASAAP